ncbi:hypothetical protein GT755_01715 [Herbidospora sp. NEAU-GS84]|uniref:SAF domain-containing protein n=1 Tax=Herbidospora solisilvae TaxID=2696284 RepID=A0A7C9JQ26_9ACTN|nr:SAF domain-containing protein [Herbidospora solisilvae]NAS20399.1 hypothetical protein [Herbidospora solisilvae]
MTGNHFDQPIGESEPIPEGAIGHRVAPGAFARLAPEAAREDRPARPRAFGSRAGTISGYVLVALATGMVMMFLWRDADAGQMPVLVLKEDLPAHRMLTEDDVTLSTATSAGKDGYVSLPVTGRLTLRAVKKDQPLTKADLSPDVTKVLGTAPVVVGVSVPHPGGLNGALQSGDRVRLLLSGATGVRAEVDAFVLSVASGGAGRQASLVVALRRKDAERHAAALLEGNILVVKRVRA